MNAKIDFQKMEYTQSVEIDDDIVIYAESTVKFNTGRVPCEVTFTIEGKAIYCQYRVYEDTVFHRYVMSAKEADWLQGLQHLHLDFNQLYKKHQLNGKKLRLNAHPERLFEF